MSMFTCIAVNLPVVIVLPRPVIMFYMIFDLFQHKYNAFYRRGELFPIWVLVAQQLYCEQWIVRPLVHGDAVY